MGKLQLHRYKSLLFSIIAICFHRIFSYLEDDLAIGKACLGKSTLDGGVDIEDRIDLVGGGLSEVGEGLIRDGSEALSFELFFELGLV